MFLPLQKILNRLLRQLRLGRQDPHLVYQPYVKRKPKHQIEFRRNEEKILSGVIPERLERFRKVVPGSRILEIGSADGTLSLALGREKETVIGLELMDYRHETALRVQQAWLDRGEGVAEVKFVCGDVAVASKFLEKVDCVVLSRTLYHLGSAARPLFEEIQKRTSVRHVALLGNRDKEMRHIQGPGIKRLDSEYLALAGLEGMINFLESYGFQITVEMPSSDFDDPIVVGSRN